MLLTAVRDEFSFHCQSRKLSPRTIKNYTKQIAFHFRILLKLLSVGLISPPEPVRWQRE